jgi:hypothetical protein
LCSSFTVTNLHVTGVSTSARAGNASATIDSAGLSVDNVSAKAASFLLDYTYNSTLGLCTEVYGSSGNSLGFQGQVCWILTDNLLACYALQPYNESVSSTINGTIQGFAKNYSLPVDSNGNPMSYKHEPIIGDVLPDQPLTANNYTLRNESELLVMTEVDNGTTWSNWMDYADEYAWMGMSNIIKGNQTEATRLYYLMMNMWDGYGFADSAYTTPGYGEYGHYEAFKLALAIIFRERLGLPKPAAESQMEDILATCQGPDGGIATGYYRGFSTAGHNENTETTALIIIANVTVSKPKEGVKVGFYYYAWYGDGFGGRHWNDSVVGTVEDKPVLGYYSSQNTTIIRQHLDWFKELNISFLIISWWGPNSYEDNTTKIIFSMVKQYNYPIEIAIMVEAYNWSGNYDAEAIYDYINNTYVAPYGNIYMKLNDLPLVCFFNDNINMTRTEENRTALLSVHGFSSRIVGQSSYVDWWAWPLAGNAEAPDPILSRDGYVGILPSYDDTHLPNKTNTTYDINYTQGLYDDQWKKVLALENMTGEVNFVGIYSWNEYHERSEVEPHISPDGKVILLPFAETYSNIQMIPEFASSLALSLFMIATLLTVIVYRRKRASVLLNSELT